MITTKLTIAQRSTIANALHVAALEYDNCAMVHALSSSEAVQQTAARKKAVAQFCQQREDAQRLARMLEGADEIAIVNNGWAP